MSKPKTVADVIRQMHEQANGYDADDLNLVSYTEMEHNGAVASVLRFWAQQLGDVLRGDNLKENK